MTVRWACWVLVLAGPSLLPLSRPALAQAQQGSGDDVTAAEAARLRALLDKSAAFVELFPDAATATPMEAIPVHRWTNNERDPHGQGLFIIWTHRGRAEAAASIYPWNKNLIHDLESLSRGTLVCRRDGAAVWQPERGLTFNVVPNAEAPAEAPAVRLRQMKAVADQFAVTMTGWRGDNADREVLRRLPKEFFRYKPEQSELIDGAVFAFVKGTDPEALLIVEAVKVKDAARFEYAFVRATSGGLEARHKDRVVWTLEKYASRRDPTQLSFTSATTLDEAYARIGRTPSNAPRNPPEK
jgi:hypothetical protein